MGQASKSYIAIFLREGKELPLAISGKTALQQSMLTHYYKTHPEAVGEPDITITEFHNYDNKHIELELYSGRRPNLDFQVDLLMEYLTGFDDIIEEVTEDTWVQD